MIGRLLKFSEDEEDDNDDDWIAEEVDGTAIARKPSAVAQFSHWETEGKIT